MTGALDLLDRFIPGRVRAAAAEDAIDGVPMRAVAAPTTVDAVAKTLAWANESGEAVFPRGGGARLGWGRPPARSGIVLALDGLASIIEHAWADLTVTAQAGVTLAALQAALAERGQRLALDPPWPAETTVGGLIAADDSGPLRFRFGGVRDLLLGVTVVRADGIVARGGSKVVKNVAGYDLPKLFTGALGTLGVVVEATFRLHPLPRRETTLVYQTAAPTDLLLRVLRSRASPVALSATILGRAGRLLVRLAGSEAGVRDQVARVVDAAGAPSDRLEGELAATAWRDAVTLPWTGCEPAAVVRVSVLPSEIPALVAAAAASGLPAAGIIHAHGLGCLRLEGEPEALHEAVGALRARLAPRDGTLVVLAAPQAVKARLDVWGIPPDVLPLMRRVREQFDPNAILNPGRLVPLDAA
ncbi:MAG: FAD-binding oxidoreductase [Chloroflexota bacterium]|nr:FAD-binding oxidoreductase [Dehalococcoidia bacterium]MDW8254713.1 FAD-binding oxidoreductase [Chloroflexota bacterium]